MRYYDAVYRALALPDTALKVALGEIALVPAATVPFISEGFPPALIPLWSSDFGYYGFWKHWFSGRSTPIVSITFGDHFVAHEVARNFEQLSVLMISQLLCSSVCDEQHCRELSLEMGLEAADFDELLDIAETSGDHPVGLRRHRRFHSDPPLACFENPQEYRGDFPVPSLAGQVFSRTDICGFELPLPLLQSGTESPLALWLSPPAGYLTQPAVFRSCLEAGNLEGAWLSLNSPAWSAEEARGAIHLLARRAANPQFEVLAHAWSLERQGFLA